jgi:hypothetical protein
MTALMEKPSQTEFPLGILGLSSHKLFPGRKTLMVPEVAKALGIDEKQVITFIIEGDSSGVKLDAVEVTGRGNKSSREHWRVTVDGYDDLLRRRHNNRPVEGRRP